MGFLVRSGAKMICVFGAAPSTLVVLPVNRTLAGAPAANILDMKPMVNILPFGMCSCPQNPMVIAATAAKLGVFTPQPCIPAPAGPWKPGCPRSLIGGKPAVNQTCTLNCAYGGVISILDPGQQSIIIK